MKAGDRKSAEGAGGAASKPQRVHELPVPTAGQRGHAESPCFAGAAGRAGGDTGEREAESESDRKEGEFNLNDINSGIIVGLLLLWHGLFFVAVMWADCRHTVEAGRAEKRASQYQ